MATSMLVLCVFAIVCCYLRLLVGILSMWIGNCDAGVVNIGGIDSDGVYVQCVAVVL